MVKKSAPPYFQPKHKNMYSCNVLWLCTLTVIERRCHCAKHNNLLVFLGAGGESIGVFSFKKCVVKKSAPPYFQPKHENMYSCTCWGRVGLSVHVGGKSIFQNSCSYVLIMYSKGISNILNRFPALILPYLHSWALYRLTKIFCKP